MNTTRRIGGVLLGPLALLLALPLESGGGVGNGPCATAHTLYHISGQSGHSFGGNFNPPWSKYEQGTRSNSHDAAWPGALSSAQHPGCTPGGGEDPDPVEVE